MSGFVPKIMTTGKAEQLAQLEAQRQKNIADDARRAAAD